LTFYYFILAYAICSGGIAILGVTVIAKRFFFPKPKIQDSKRQLIELGPDGAGLRSERYPSSDTVEVWQGICSAEPAGTFTGESVWGHRVGSSATAVAKKGYPAGRMSRGKM